MRLIRRHGKAMLLHQKWKVGGSLAVGALMVGAVILVETHQRLSGNAGIAAEDFIVKQERPVNGSRRLSFYPNDYIITKRDSKGTIDWDTGFYENAPAGNKCGIIVHIIGTIYMLVGLNTVCDIYFCGALDEMVENFGVAPDVAGATFMAAGGSAPELFTSLIGAVGTESDVGFGTIVGSAVFNVLAVIGCCGLCAPEPIKLTWWPLFRDCTFYIFGLCLLAIFAYGESIELPDGTRIGGGEIKFHEAIILFVCYLLYILIMVFNEKLEACFGKLFGMTPKVAPELEELAEEGQGPRKSGEGDAAPAPPADAVDGAPAAGTPNKLEPTSGGTKNLASAKSHEALKHGSSKHSLSHHGTACLDHHAGHGPGVVHIPAHIRRRVEHHAHAVHHHHHEGDGDHHHFKSKSKSHISESPQKKSEETPKEKPKEESSAEPEAKPDDKPPEGEEPKGDEETGSISSTDTDDIAALVTAPDAPWLPEGCSYDAVVSCKIAWALCLPVYAPMYYGIPRPDKGGKWFLATFGMALLFIAAYSYWLVYCVEMFGKAILGAEKNAGVAVVLSFTILAAGTSIPDLVSSKTVAMAGEGDMAVSSSIGSNIFDILVGLPVPWILKIAIVESKTFPNYGIPIRSPYIAMYVFLLLFMVACVIISIMINKWYLNKKLGWIMSFLYAVFLIIVLPVELVNKGPYI